MFTILICGQRDADVLGYSYGAKWARNSASG